jgi:hypothetical protein
VALGGGGGTGVGGTGVGVAVNVVGGNQMKLLAVMCALARQLLCMIR